MPSTIGIVLLQPSDLEQSFPSEERGLLTAHRVGTRLILRHQTWDGRKNTWGWGQGWDMDSWDRVMFRKNPTGIGPVGEVQLSGGLLGVAQGFRLWFWSLMVPKIVNTSKWSLNLYLQHVTVSYKKPQPGLTCAVGEKRKLVFLPEVREAASVVLAVGGWLCQQVSRNTGRRGNSWDQSRRREQKIWGRYKHQKPEKNHKKS